MDGYLRGRSLLGKVTGLGPPDFTDADALALWIDRVRTLAFFNGARHHEITKAEVAALLPHIRSLLPPPPKEG